MEHWASTIMPFVALAIGIAILLRRDRMTVWGVAGLGAATGYFAGAALLGGEDSRDLFFAAAIFAVITLREWARMRGP